MIRLVEIQTDDVRRADAANLQRLLSSVERDPQDVRTLQGTIVLGFREFERDDQELPDDPHVLAYLRAAHAALPHLFYFLAPDAPAGPVMFFLIAHARPDQLRRDNGVPGVLTDEPLMDLLTQHLAATAVFAERMADDAAAVLGRIVEGTGEPAMRRVADIALQAARLLQERTSARTAVES